MEEPSMEEVIIRAQDHQAVKMYPNTEFDDCAICLLIDFAKETYL